ncbi:MAG: zinc-dependent metalloprotease [Halobacteriales archaeon]
MNLARSVRAVAGASGDGNVDWDAVAAAAKAATDSGDLSVSDAEREAYAADVRAARDRIRAVSGVEFDLPASATVVNRHHWIDRNVETFARVMAPIENRDPDEFGGAALQDLARVLNTGSMSFAVSMLARKVIGQYDPLLLADGDDHALYFVHPNVERTAGELDVDRDLFRRWIAFHEVTHAAEFGGTPWLSDHLETRLEAGVEALSAGGFDRDAFRELNTAMTAVEGYAELLMDRAFDEDAAAMREKLERRRRASGPVSWLLQRVLGLGLKRRQYERGKRFFEAVADARGVEAAGVVWERPGNLPSDAELDHPQRWLDRVDP